MIWAGAALFGLRGSDVGESRKDAAPSLATSVAINFRETGAILTAARYALYVAQHIGRMVWLPTILSDTRAAPTILAPA